VFAQKTSAVLTNVQGPTEPVYFAGSKIAGVVAWVPSAGTIGMGIKIFSYDGGVTVGLQVDAGLIPDPDTIIADYERELEALRQLAPTAGVSGPRADSTRPVAASPHAVISPETAVRRCAAVLGAERGCDMPTRRRPASGADVADRGTAC
jgi:hypothetical protein